jgi:hypothetical protein
MARTPRDWRIELMEAHPNLFHPSQAHPERVNGYPACGDGWRDLLERACDRIESALAEGGAFNVFQIKEKFGTLRFYWDGEVSPETRSRTDEAIALAEARSACTCETCGEPGRLYQIAGWYKTACNAHADVEPVHVKAGRENARQTSLRRRQARRPRPPLHPRDRRVRRRRSAIARHRGVAAMARFRCRACGEEGAFVYTVGHACPRCGSRDVQLAIGVEELEDDHPLVEAMRLAAEDGGKNEDET